MDATLSGGLAKGGWAVLGTVTEGGDSSLDVTFLQKSQGLVKKHHYFMQAVWALLWTDCFETYMVVSYIAPYHEESQEISVLTIWDL